MPSDHSVLEMVLGRLESVRLVDGAWCLHALPLTRDCDGRQVEATVRNRDYASLAAPSESYSRAISNLSDQLSTTVLEVRELARTLTAAQQQLSQLSHSFELLEHEQGAKRLSMARFNSALVDLTEWRENAEGSITDLRSRMKLAERKAADQAEAINDCVARQDFDHFKDRVNSLVQQAVATHMAPWMENTQSSVRALERRLDAAQANQDHDAQFAAAQKQMLDVMQEKLKTSVKQAVEQRLQRVEERLSISLNHRILEHASTVQDNVKQAIRHALEEFAREVGIVAHDGGEGGASDGSDAEDFGVVAETVVGESELRNPSRGQSRNRFQEVVARQEVLCAELQALSAAVKQQSTEQAGIVSLVQQLDDSCHKLDARILQERQALEQLVSSATSAAEQNLKQVQQAWNDSLKQQDEDIRSFYQGAIESLEQKQQQQMDILQSVDSTARNAASSLLSLRAEVDRLVSSQPDSERLDQVAMRVEQLVQLTTSLQDRVRDHGQQLLRAAKLEEVLGDMSRQVTENERHVTELWSTFDGYGLPKLRDSMQEVLSRVKSLAESLECTGERCDSVAKEIEILQRRLEGEREAQHNRLQTLHDQVDKLSVSWEHEREGHTSNIERLRQAIASIEHSVSEAHQRQAQQLAELASKFEQLEAAKPSAPSPAKSVLLSPGSSLFGSVSPTSTSAEEFVLRQMWPGGDTDEEALPHRLLGRPGHVLPPLDTSSLRRVGSSGHSHQPSGGPTPSPALTSSRVTESCGDETNANALSEAEPTQTGELRNTESEHDVADERGNRLDQAPSGDREHQAEHPNHAIGDHGQTSESCPEIDGQSDESSDREPREMQSDADDDVSEAITDPPGLHVPNIEPTARVEAEHTDLHAGSALEIEEIPDIDVYEVESSADGDGGWEKSATAGAASAAAEGDSPQTTEFSKLSARDRLRLRLQQSQEAKARSPQPQEQSSVELSNSWDESFDDS